MVENNQQQQVRDGDSLESPVLTEASRRQLEQFRSAHATQVLTILFSDIVGSTQLQNKMGNVRGKELIGHHRLIFREALKGFDGQEVETAGDSFLVVFSMPSEGVKFALHMQAAMRRARQNDPELPAVRVGIHQGQVVVERHETGPKPMDIYGLQVSAAARIMDLAQGAQILCSRAVFDDARAILREDDLRSLGPVGWQNHGPYHFKGVEDTYDVCEVGEEDVTPLAAPPAGAKGWPAGHGTEELGWRPAAGVAVPGTNWVLEERLGKEEDEKDVRRKFRGEFGEVWKAWNASQKSHEVFKFCFKRDRVPVLKREARLLKRLQKHRHPNLVEVYDVTEGDRPPYYLEMEYVEGPTLEEWLATNPPLNERLEIVAQVADALDTVHAAGIYHRDIKPSNILLTRREDGTLLAKLTDFGLGAAEDAELLKSIPTSRVEGVAGTWDYIAPELRKGSRTSPQSDIYSLGLTLFQIVAGDLRGPAGPGWEKLIESEVLREVVAKCMDADPGKRWKPAAELSKALRSHDERVDRLRLEREHEAQRKRARRLKVTAAVVGLFAVVTLGLGGFAWHQRGVAEKLREKAQKEAETSKAVTDYLQAMLSTASPNWAQGQEVTVRMLLDVASKTVGRRFRNQPLVEASVRTTIGMTYKSLGLYGEAEPHLAQAWLIRQEALGDSHPDTLDSLAKLGSLFYEHGKYGQAEKLHRQVLATKQAVLGKDHPDTLSSMNYLANVLCREGKYLEAEELYRQVASVLERGSRDQDDNSFLFLLGIRDNIGFVLSQQGKCAEAEKLNRQALAGRQRVLGANHPGTVETMHNLAIALHCQGKYAEAEELYRQVLAAKQKILGKEHPYTLECMKDLAILLTDQGKYAEAEDLQRHALAAKLRVLGKDHPETLKSMKSLADCLESSGKKEEAMQLREKRSEALQRATKEAADVGNLYALAYNYRGLDCHNRDDYDCAIQYYGKAIELKPDYAEAFANRGTVYNLKSENDRAIQDLSKAIELDPNLAKAHLARGRTYYDKGDSDHAIQDCSKAIELKPDFADAYALRGSAFYIDSNWDRAVQDLTKAIELDPDSAVAYYNRGTTYNRKGDSDSAIQDLSQAIELKPDYAQAYCERGSACYAKGDYDSAIQNYDKAIELKPDFVLAYDDRGRTYHAKGDYDRAWADVRMLRKIGGKIDSKFIEDLRKASGKNE